MRAFWWDTWILWCWERVVIDWCCCCTLTSVNDEASNFDLNNAGLSVRLLLTSFACLGFMLLHVKSRSVSLCLDVGSYTDNSKRWIIPLIFIFCKLCYDYVSGHLSALLHHHKQPHKVSYHSGCSTQSFQYNVHMEKMISISWQKVIFAFNDNQQGGYHLRGGTRLPKQPKNLWRC